MATKKAIDGGQDTAASGEGELDQAIDELRGVLKKDAGELPFVDNESVDTMSGGAQAFGSDFGADFSNDGADAGLNDPFNLGDDDVEQAGDTAFASTPGFDADFGDAMPASAPGAGAPRASEPGADFGLADANPAGASVIGATGTTSRFDLVLDIPIDVQIILGTSRMAVSSLMNLSEGATIALDRKIGEPVEIVVNGKMIGRGEITVLDSDETRFGVRLIEVVGSSADKKGN